MFYKQLQLKVNIEFHRMDFAICLSIVMHKLNYET